MSTIATDKQLRNKKEKKRKNAWQNQVSRKFEILLVFTTICKRTLKIVEP